MKIINGENLILGRVASRVAKAALLGEETIVLNCEKMMVTGNHQTVIGHQRFLDDLKGKPNRGRFYYVRPDMFVRRSIRGMLPKNPRGKIAYSHVKCYISVPEPFKGKSSETFEADNLSKVPNLKYMSVAEICRLMGGTW